jgi:cobalt/nickel transport system permease protein
MHIPDNFLATPVWASLDAIAMPAVALVSRRARTGTDTSRLPLLGVMGAFVFAAQMINFPVGAGTSGHLVGGTLLACLLGPEAAALVVTSILIVQALVFQDGGVLALGANVFNMALCGVLAGYLPFAWLRRTKWKYHAVFLGGVCSVCVSGVLALAELTLSGIRMPPALLIISGLLFLANAVLEGAITTVVLRSIERMNPGLSTDNAEMPERPGRGFSGAVALVSLLLTSFGILVASTAPDGIEQLALKLGVRWNTPVLHSPLANYEIQALGTTWLSKAGAGLLGLAAIYTVCVLGSHVLARARRTYTS